MSNLMVAAAFFAGLHLLVSGTRLRDGLVRRLGAKTYMALFSLASAVGLTALIVCYGQVRAPAATVWQDGLGVAAVLNFLALLLVVFGVTSRGPTAVGGGSKLGEAGAVSGIHRVSRHPMLWGFALWALTHMLFNPEPVNLIFFGTFLTVAFCGTFSIDAKRARIHGEAWSRYLAQTSNWPFLAIIHGRNQLVLNELGWARPLGCLVLFAALIALHQRLFGLPAI